MKFRRSATKYKRDLKYSEDGLTTQTVTNKYTLQSILLYKTITEAEQTNT